jgi:hypothetical protein
LHWASDLGPGLIVATSEFSERGGAQRSICVTREASAEPSGRLRPWKAIAKDALIDPMDVRGARVEVFTLPAWRVHLGIGALAALSSSPASPRSP